MKQNCSDCEHRLDSPDGQSTLATELLSRRGALGRLAALLAGLGGLSLLSSCPGGTVWSRAKKAAAAKPPRPGQLYFRTYDVPLNVLRDVEIAGQPAYLAHFNDSKDTYWTVMSRRCTHAGCLVAYDNSKKVLRCPCHGAVFDLHGDPISGPAKLRLTRWPVEVKDNGVFIDTTRELDPQQPDVPLADPSRL